MCGNQCCLLSHLGPDAGRPLVLAPVGPEAHQHRPLTLRQVDEPGVEDARILDAERTLKQEGEVLPVMYETWGTRQCMGRGLLGPTLLTVCRMACIRSAAWSHGGLHAMHSRTPLAARAALRSRSPDRKTHDCDKAGMKVRFCEHADCYWMRGRTSR